MASVTEILSGLNLPKSDYRIIVEKVKSGELVPYYQNGKVFRLGSPEKDYIKHRRTKKTEKYLHEFYDFDSKGNPISYYGGGRVAKKDKEYNQVIYNKTVDYISGKMEKLAYDDFNRRSKVVERIDLNTGQVQSYSDPVTKSDRAEAKIRREAREEIKSQIAAEEKKISLKEQAYNQAVQKRMSKQVTEDPLMSELQPNITLISGEEAYATAPIIKKIDQKEIIGVYEEDKSRKGILGGIKKKVEELRTTSLRSNNQYIGAGAGLISSGVSTVNFGKSLITNPLGTVEQTIVGVGNLITGKTDLSPVARTLFQEPGYAVGYVGGEILTAKGLGAGIGKASTIPQKLAKPKIISQNVQNIVTQQTKSGQISRVAGVSKVKVGKRIIDVKVEGKEIGKNIGSNKQLFTGDYKITTPQSTSAQLSMGVRAKKGSSIGSIEKYQTRTVLGKKKYQVTTGITGTKTKEFLISREGLKTQSTASLSTVSKISKGKNLGNLLKKQPNFEQSLSKGKLTSVEAGFIKEKITFDKITASQAKLTEIKGKVAISRLKSELKDIVKITRSSKKDFGKPSSSGGLKTISLSQGIKQTAKISADSLIRTPNLIAPLPKAKGERKTFTKTATPKSSQRSRIIPASIVIPTQSFIKTSKTATTPISKPTTKFKSYASVRSYTGQTSAINYKVYSGNIFKQAPSIRTDVKPMNQLRSFVPTGGGIGGLAGTRTTPMGSSTPKPILKIPKLNTGLVTTKKKKKPKSYKRQFEFKSTIEGGQFSGQRIVPKITTGLELRRI